MVNKGSLTFVCMFLIFGICDCQKKKDPVQGILTKTSKAINITNTKFKDVIKGTINAPLKPLDWTGVKLEESVVSSTKVIGKFSNAAGKKIKKLGKYLQKKETKFLNCIKQEQFDPVKAIIVDFSTCITSKTDSVNKIIQNSLKQLNNTSTIFKKIVLIPKCESAKCYADYSSEIVAKTGSIGVGLASITKDLTLSIAAAPITVPVCFVSKPVTGPVKTIGKLGVSVSKCFTKP